MINNKTRIILVRHGRSTYNDQQRYQGCCDESVLTEQGKQQALETGIALSKIDFDAVYASPLQRTQETAREIFRATNSTAKLYLNSNLKEIDLPGWQGLQYQYVRQELKEEYKIWEKSPHEFTIENTEISGQTLIKIKNKPVLELYDRAKNFWQEILPHHQGKTILVVSHGGTIRALLGTATGIKPCDYHAIQQSNGGISVLDFENSLTSAKITAINLTQHLGEILPKLKNGKYGLRLLLLPVDFSNNQPNCNLKKLRNFLKQVELDFCFTHDIYENQLIIESIINQSKSPFILQVSRADCLDIWHQKISKRSLKSNSLTTGLVIADTKMISNLLSQALGLNSATSLQINSGELSILFYPKCQSKPVLQTMNITEIF